MFGRMPAGEGVHGLGLDAALLGAAVAAGQLSGLAAVSCRLAMPVATPNSPGIGVSAGSFPPESKPADDATERRVHEEVLHHH